jgi:hypothetical protein
MQLLPYIIYITSMSLKHPETTVKKLLTLPEPLAREIVEFWFQNRISSESEAMRRLLAAGLEKAMQEHAAKGDAS